jgi:hypothetical protein
MGDGMGAQSEDVGVGYLLGRKSVPEMEQEYQYIALPVSPSESASENLDQFVFNQFIGVGISGALSSMPFFLHVVGGFDGSGLDESFHAVMPAQAVDRHAGCDVHQVNFGLDLGLATEAAERGTVILKNF